MDREVQIPLRAAVQARLTLAGQSDLGASSTPAGRGTFRVRERRTAPRPLQFLQGEGITSPVPLQAGQAVTLTIEPRKVSRTWRTSPLPRQVVQRTGEVPGSAPEPRQTSQTSSRSRRISFSTPEAA